VCISKAKWGGYSVPYITQIISVLRE